jgi:hypothetical protein
MTTTNADTAESTPVTTKQRLTDVELETLAFLHDFFHVNHQLPTLQAMTEGGKGKLQINSHSTAVYRLRALERKGYLEKNAIGNYRFVNGRATILFQGAGL